MLSEEYRYRILKRLEADPEISRRELAKALGISLGRANYCIKALVEKGLVKANNKHKMAGYEALKSEIEKRNQPDYRLDTMTLDEDNPPLFETIMETP